MEELCVAFVVDVLLNRPIDLEGKIVKYSASDKVVLRKFIAEQRENVENKKVSLTSNSYEGLIKLYDGVSQLLGIDII